MAASFVERPVRNQIYECEQYLKRKFGPVNSEIIGSFPSYLSGLQHHPDTVSAIEQDQIYLCQFESNANHANALGVINEDRQRVGWAPRNLADYLARSLAKEEPRTKFVMFCYITGRPTPRSCQCIYNVFTLLPTPVSVAPDTSMQIDQPSTRV